MENCLFCNLRTRNIVGITPARFFRSVSIPVCQDCAEITSFSKVEKIADGMVRESFAQEGCPLDKDGRYIDYGKSNTNK